MIMTAQCESNSNIWKWIYTNEHTYIPIRETALNEAKSNIPFDALWTAAPKWYAITRVQAQRKQNKNKKHKALMPLPGCCFCPAAAAAASVSTHGPKECFNVLLGKQANKNCANLRNTIQPPKKVKLFPKYTVIGISKTIKGNRLICRVAASCWKGSIDSKNSIHS